MKRFSVRLLFAVASAGAMIMAATLGSGCGGIDCTETATCPEFESGASDQSVAPVPDAPVNLPETSSSEAEAASEAEAEAEADDAEPDASLQDATMADADGAADADATVDAAADADAARDADAGLDAADAADAKGDACVPTSTVENCTNGIDDNCDGLVDCDDPQCTSGFSCVPAAPTGWFGPGALYDGLSTATSPACVAPFPNNAFQLNSTPLSPAFTCGCACGGVTGACTTPIITVFSDNQCLSTNNCGAGGPATCTVADGTRCGSGGFSVGVTSLPVSTMTGSCPSNSTTVTMPPSTWQRSGEACGGSRVLVPGGCSAGSVCAEKPSSGFQPKLCVWQQGNTDCSSATGYPLLFKYYSQTVDTRGCSEGTCGCATASGVSCALTSATAYKSATCADGGTAINDLNLLTGNNAAGHCNVLSNDSIVAMTATVAATGSCGTTGTGTATGSVVPDPSTAWTVCCSQ